MSATLGGGVGDRFYVVAVGVADERAVVAGMVLGHPKAGPCGRLSEPETIGEVLRLPHLHDLVILTGL